MSQDNNEDGSQQSNVCCQNRKKETNCQEDNKLHEMDGDKECINREARQDRRRGTGELNKTRFDVQHI